LEETSGADTVGIWQENARIGVYHELDINMLVDTKFLPFSW
jgi:hypothetical protein